MKYQRAAGHLKGRNTINFLEMQKGEKVSAIIAIDDFESESSLVLCTKKGVVKKTRNKRI